MTRVAIVGGGASGLLAAAQCRHRGFEVTLFEASHRVGGVIQTVTRDGWIAERGPTSLAEPLPAVRSLLTQAGVDQVLVRADPTKRQRFLLHQGSPVPIPTRVADLVASPLLSLGGRLRLLKEPFIERGAVNEEESVDSFVRRRLGSEVADNIIDPYLAGSSGGDPEKLLARHVLPKLVEYERLGGSILKGAMRSRRQARRRGPGGGSWSCRAGLQQLIDCLSASLGAAIRLNAPVTSVIRGAQGFELHGDKVPADLFDALILAVPAPALKTMAFGMNASRFQQIAEIPCTSMATVSLGFSREAIGQPLDGSGVLVGSKERRSILDVIFPAAIFPDRVPTGGVLMTAHVGGGRRPETTVASDDELEALVLTELRDIFRISGPVLFRDIARSHEAMPQTVAGHSGRLEIAALIERENRGLALCGAWRDGISVNESMAGGVQAADRIVPAA